MTNLIPPSATSHQPTSTRLRHLGDAFWPGLLIVVYGAVQADGAVLTTAYREASPISDDRLSYPWDGAAAVTTSVVWGLSQILFVIGLRAFATSAALTRRSGRRGAWSAVVGASLFVAAHAVSIPLHDADVDDAGAVAVFTLFGLGTILTAGGLLAAGIDVARSRIWTDWRRLTPLALGVWMVAMIPLQFTPALAIVVGVYALLAAALGIALLVESAARADAATPPLRT
ncbi:MAG: hypothetical protein ACKVWR_11005 [Acidimicrobiales bacterium]